MDKVRPTYSTVLGLLLTWSVVFLVLLVRRLLRPFTGGLLLLEVTPFALVGVVCCCSCCSRINCCCFSNIVNCCCCAGVKLASCAGVKLAIPTGFFFCCCCCCCCSNCSFFCFSSNIWFFSLSSWAWRWSSGNLANCSFNNCCCCGDNKRAGLTVWVVLGVMGVVVVIDLVRSMTLGSVVVAVGREGGAVDEGSCLIT